MGISVVRDFDKLRRFNVEQLYDQYQSTQDKGNEQKGKTGEQKQEVEPTVETKSGGVKEDVNKVDDIENHDGKVEAIEWKGDLHEISWRWYRIANWKMDCLWLTLEPLHLISHSSCSEHPDTRNVYDKEITKDAEITTSCSNSTAEG